MKIKCILFDADGVVINSELFSVKYQKEYGVSNEEMLPFFLGEFQNCIIGKADLKELLNPWLPKWEWNKPTDDFLKFWFEAEHKIDDRMINIIDVLKSKGIKCYLATNQEKYRTKYMKDEMNFENIFDKIYSSYEIGHKKPNKEFYEHILDDIETNHNISPHEILFFDDSEKNINSAKDNTKINAYLYNDFDKFTNLLESLRIL